MNPLLFLGSEYLFRMTDPAVPEEEQETYRAGLARISHQQCAERDGSAEIGWVRRTLDEESPAEESAR